MRLASAVVSLVLLSACGLLDRDPPAEDDDEGSGWDSGWTNDGGTGDGGTGDGGSGDGGTGDGGTGDGGTGDGGTGDGGTGDGGTGDGGTGDGGTGDGGAGDGGTGDGGTGVTCDDLAGETGDSVATGNTRGESDDFDSSSCAGSGGVDVAYTWTAPGTGCWTIDTIGSDFDTVLLILDGDCGGSTVECDAAGGGDLTSLIERELEGGDELTIVVDGYDEDDAGDFQLNINPCDSGGSDTGRFYSGYRGEAEIDTDSDAGWEGLEEAYYIGLGTALECIVLSELSTTAARDDCADCDWAFDLDFHDSTFSSETGCELIGVTDASDYDTDYSYGYQSDYYISGYGYYGVLQFYFSGYGWYAVALAELDGSTFTYDWPNPYYYSYDL